MIPFSKLNCCCLACRDRLGCSGLGGGGKESSFVVAFVVVFAVLVSFAAASAPQPRPLLLLLTLFSSL